MVSPDTSDAPDLPQGYDEEDPYAEEDLSSYPKWWKQNIKEFREYDLRPYRPPRFIDGALTPIVINSLESELEVEIRSRTVNPHKGNEGEFLVDEKPVLTVKRRRTKEGYTVYKLTSNEFKALIQDAISSE